MRLGVIQTSPAVMLPNPRLKRTRSKAVPPEAWLAPW